MSDTVDLIVIGMAETMSAEELAKRLIAEFNQPADAFDALISAATGAGPAYAAQSGVGIDVALDGKAKLESLGLLCNIPGVTDLVTADASPASVQATSESVEEAGLSVGATEAGADLFDEAGALELDDSSDAGGLTEPAGAETESFDVDETDFLSSLDTEGPVDSGSDAQSSDHQQIESATDDGGSFDFADELEALGKDGELAELSVEPKPAAAAEELDFSDTFEELQFEDSIEDPGAAEEAMVSGVASDEIEESSLESSTKEAAAAIQPVELEASLSNSVGESVDASPADDIDTSEITISDNDGIPLTAPRKSSNRALDDGGLSLASEDSIAPIKVRPTDVPAALANRKPADGVEELGLSLDETTARGTKNSAADISSATGAGLSSIDEQVSDMDSSINLQAELPTNFEVESISLLGEGEQTNELVDEGFESDDVEVVADLSALDETSGQGDVTEPAVQELTTDESETLDLSGVDTSAKAPLPEPLPVDLPVAPADEPDPVDRPAPVVEPVPVDNSAVTGEQSVAGEQSAAVDQGTDKPDLNPPGELEDSRTGEPTGAAAPKSIAEELIESLQGQVPEAEPAASTSAGGVNVATFNALPPSSKPNFEQEQLRKSREQVAVLQEKIEEDLVEEEQVYQEFEQIAKKRTIKQAIAGLAGAAGVAAVCGGVYFSGVLTPKPEVAAPSVVAEVKPQRDHEQESLNAALERSATLINPQTLSTEELLTSLAQGSGQDTLGDLRRYILGGSARVADKAKKEAASVPRAGAAIPADSDSMKLLKNRVSHSGDKYFDEWSRREIDLRLYLELVDRLIDAGDIVAATELCNRTKDNLFAVMGKQSVARAYKRNGDLGQALKLLETASRNAYSIASAAERVVAMADYAYSEHIIGLYEDSLDSYLNVSILAASLNRSEYKTVGHAAVSDYLMQAGMGSESQKQLQRAIGAALELPGNSAARDLALRHIVLTEARLGLFEEAIRHSEQIIDPFASVSAFHGIALEYESRKDYAMATEVIQKAFDASSVIKDKEKRRQLLSKIQLANSD